MDEFLEQLGALMAGSFAQGVIATKLRDARDEVAFHEREFEEAANVVTQHYFRIRELMNFPILGSDDETPPEKVN